MYEKAEYAAAESGRVVKQRGGDEWIGTSAFISSPGDAMGVAGHDVWVADRRHHADGEAAAG